MRILTATLTIVTLWCTAGASGALVQQNLNFEYSGGTPPVGAAPWLQAEFDDGGGSGSVTMKLTSLNLTGSEFVNDWFFNLDAALDPTQLSFQVQNTTGAFANPAVLTGTDAFLAAGATRFDILVDFANAPPESRFGAGDSITFLVTGIPGLTANSFNVLSVAGGKGPFISAAHVQSIGPSEDSGWIAIIPEPAMLSALAGVALLLQRRR